MENKTGSSCLPVTLQPLMYSEPQPPKHSSHGERSGTAPREDMSKVTPPPYTLPPLPPFPLRPLKSVLPPASVHYPRPKSVQTTEPSNPPGSVGRLSASLMSIPHDPASRYASPINSDPAFHTSRSPSLPTPGYTFPPPRREGFQASPWREGEPGPSSLIHSRYPRDEEEKDEQRGINRRSSPLQYTQKELQRATNSYQNRGSTRWEERQSEAVSQRHGFDPSAQSPGSLASEPFRPQFRHTYPPSVQEYDRSARSSHRSSSTPFPNVNGDGRGTNSFLARLPGSQTLGSTNSGSGRSSETGDLPTNSTPVGKTCEDEGDPAIYKRRKSRQETDDEDEGITQLRVRRPRKTDIACDFCRGRKLRCDGSRPSCRNCVTRSKPCVYRHYNRRRGPGKAPKGARPKKKMKTHFLEPSSSQPFGGQPEGSINEFDVDNLALVRPLPAYIEEAPLCAPISGTHQARGTPRSDDGLAEEYQGREIEEKDDTSNLEES